MCLSILGGIAAWHFYNKDADAKLALGTARTMHSQALSRFQDRQGTLQNLQANYELYRKIYEVTQVYQEASGRVAGLQAEIASEKARYVGVVETRRQAAIGTVIEKLSLADGREIKNARVLKFNDTSLSVITGDGVLKLNVEDLPDHLKNFFRFDLIEPSLEPPAAPTFAASTSSSSYGSSPAINSGGYSGYRGFYNPATSDREEYQSKVKQFNDTIAAYNKQIQSLQTAKNGPLGGMDRHLKPSSKAYQYRKKERDNRINQQIAGLTAQRNAVQAQAREFAKTRQKK